MLSLFFLNFKLNLAYKDIKNILKYYNFKLINKKYLIKSLLIYK